jgi:[acyl-carrier-protein] S-malonyltransferase
MQPAAERLAALLAKINFSAPILPIINNVDVVQNSDAAAIRDALVRQLYMPVRWVETIQTMTQSGVTTILECGPGKVLTGLNKRIDKHLQLMTTSDLAGIEAYLKHESERSA